MSVEWEVCDRCEGWGVVENFDCDYDAPAETQCRRCDGERVTFWTETDAQQEIARQLFEESAVCPDEADWDVRLEGICILAAAS